MIKENDCLRETVLENITKQEEWTASHYHYMTPFSQMLQDLKPSDSDFVWFTVTLHLINLFGSKDPSPVHFKTARKNLKKLEIESDKAIDMLSRELVLECQNLRKFIFKKFGIDNLSLLSKKKQPIVHCYLFKKMKKQNLFSLKMDVMPSI